MSYTVYILRSKETGRYYTGSTQNLSRRVKEHNQGKSKSTRAGSPWYVVYTEKYSSKSAALERENEIKRYKSGNSFKKLVDSQHSGIV